MSGKPNALMIQLASNHCQLLSVLVLLTALSGCQTPAPSTRVNPVAGGAAEQLYQQQRFVEAARAFIRQAGLERPDFNRLRAADAWYRADRPTRTAALLETLDPNQLGANEVTLSQLLALAVADAPPSPSGVLFALPDSAQIPDHYRALFHRFRAEAFGQRRQPFLAASERVRLDEWLNPDQQPANHQQILAGLQRLPIDQAQPLLQRFSVADPMHGWLKLVVMSKQALLDGLSVQVAVAEWQLEFPEHPAAYPDIEQYLGVSGLVLGRPENIALLLPMSGRFAAAGRAVRDGIMAAFFADPERRASIRVYDVGESAAQASLQYDLAVSDGADQIIGPLSKEAVTELLLKADGSIPVLALNESNDPIPAAAGVYQFGLLPEQDAASIARRMLADGHARAVVMVPESSRGDRLADAFVYAFQTGGGDILNVSRYPDRGSDYAPIIKSALGLAASAQRIGQLRQVTGLRLQAEPDVRADLDAIFLAASPVQGRLIKPQFNFHNASDIPVYSTASIYSGQPNAVRDKDLNGVRFCDAPWLAGAAVDAPELELVRQQYGLSSVPLRLFGLGLDAYQLLPYLDWLMGSPTDVFPGVTGALSIDAEGRLFRELGCAEFRRGLPRYLPPPEPVDRLPPVLHSELGDRPLESRLERPADTPRIRRVPRPDSN